MIEDRMRERAAHPVPLWRQIVGGMVGRWTPAGGEAIADPGGGQFREQLQGQALRAKSEQDKLKSQETLAGTAERLAATALHNEELKGATDARLAAAEDRLYPGAFPLQTYQFDRPTPMTAMDSEQQTYDAAGGPPPVGQSSQPNLPLQSPRSQFSAMSVRSPRQAIEPVPEGAVSVPPSRIDPNQTPRAMYTPAGKAALDAQSKAAEQEAVKRSGMIQLDPDWMKNNHPGVMADKNGEFWVPPDTYAKLVGQEQKAEKPLPVTHEEVQARAQGLGTSNPEANKITPDAARRMLTPIPSPDAATARDTQRSDRSYQQRNAELEKIASPIQTALDKMQRLKTVIGAGTPISDAISPLEFISALAGGQGSGIRVTAPEYQNVYGAQSKWAKLRLWAQQYSADPQKAGAKLDPQTRQQILDLADSVLADNGNQLADIEKARQALIDTDDVKQHRQIVADLKTSLAHPKSAKGGGQSGGDGNVKTVNSKEERDALPQGTKYKRPGDETVYVKQ